MGGAWEKRRSDDPDRYAAALERHHLDGPLAVNRPGLLAPDRSMAHWLTDHHHPGDGILFDPEPLALATLFGAAAAVTTLHGGTRLSELQQISNVRWVENQVPEHRDGKPTGRLVRVRLQNLLTKGKSDEGQRRFKLISDPAARLLARIGRELVARHGGLPLVYPTGNTKAEHLQPEPYFFVWSPTDPDAAGRYRIGLLGHEDFGPLYRFLFHGCDLRDANGEPIRLVNHLFRHLVAEYASHVLKDH